MWQPLPSRVHAIVYVERVRRPAVRALSMRVPVAPPRLRR